MKRVFETLVDVPLWDGVPPLHRPEDDTLREHFRDDDDFCHRLTDVSRPTLTFYPASGPGPHPCVLVCPGGGYEILAYNHEGTDVAHWLVSQGLSVALLKYRCPNRPDQALADARRAMRVIRANADDWFVDPARVGILGFSAGAALSVRTCCSTEPDYPHADATDGLSARPDFAFIVYPAYLYREGWGIDPQLSVTKETCPETFLVQSQDDPYWESSIAYSIALRKAGVPFELHLLPDGGHGWGMIHWGHSTETWTGLAMRWFRTQVMHS